MEMEGGEEESSVNPFGLNESSRGSSGESGNLGELLGIREEDEGQFEQVSLRDHEKNAAESADRRSIGSSSSMESFALRGSVDDAGSSPGSEKYHNVIGKSLSSVSVDSSNSQFADTGSPLISPPKRQKPVLPSVPPELGQLIEFSIQGDQTSIEQLREAVNGNGKEDEDVVGLARLVVDVLLATMGGVEGFEEEGEGNPPSIMHNSRAAVVAAELISSLPCEGDTSSYMSPRTRMVKGLFLILKACTRNRAMCTKEGLLGALLTSADRIYGSEWEEKQSWDGSWLCNCLQLLAQHSLSVVDLRRWLQVVSNTMSTNWGVQMMLALERAVGGREARGPSCTFEFDGESSGLLGPGESRWPFSNGFAFVTWLYIESFADTVNTAAAAAAIAAAAAAKSGKSSPMSAAAAASALAGEGTAHMPRLYSFLSADNQGVEAYFHGQFLVVESGGGKSKKSSLHFTHAFKPRCWYFIGLEHIYKQNLLGKAESEMKLYVDGALSETRPFEFPRISKPLAFCCIGTNPPPTMAGLQRRRRQCPLFAEMGPIYIFKEPIGSDRMARLAARGGDALPSFGSGAGLPWLATNERSRVLAEETYLLDADIGGKLHLLYHPSLLEGRFCPDASPSGTTGTYRRPAEVLGQVYISTRLRPSESLWAMADGGPMSLLPLVVSDVQIETLKPEQHNSQLSPSIATMSAPILRTLSLAIQFPGNNEEVSRTHGPEVIAMLLRHLLVALSSLRVANESGGRDEELVAAVVSLCQSPTNDHSLKVQLFSNLLLNLKMWSLCSYGLQKKLLSSLADMVFTESTAMRDANAVQMLLDGCRRCYWVARESDSVDTFSLCEAHRPMGEINALVDELLVVIELLLGSSTSLLATNDVRCLIGFLVDCPQQNQVARVLHLIYRLVVQPNAARAHTFAESFISCGGIETLLVLLQREAKAGDILKSESTSPTFELATDKESQKVSERENIGAGYIRENEEVKSVDRQAQALGSDSSPKNGSIGSPIDRMHSISETFLSRNLGGISFSISAASARNNIYNIDNGDGIVVGIISLLGALVTSGHLKFTSHSVSSPSQNNGLGNKLHPDSTSMSDDKLSLLLFALHKAFQAATERLMTADVYTTLLGAAINASSSDDGPNIYDSGRRFEHDQLLLVLLRSLPFASKALQARAIQDLLFLACNSENRSSLTCMDEWPEWILEVLISNFEMGADKGSPGISSSDIEDLVHNFLIIMLEHSMREKDGWKDIEATIHCAEWLCMVGGSSTGDQRNRREESLPLFKRRLLGGLLEFAARELQVQTQVIAAAAAGVASEGLSPQNAKLEAESATQLSVALAENAIVILMLVEDHLRLQSQSFSSSHSIDGISSPVSPSWSFNSRSNSLGRASAESMDAAISRRQSLSSDSAGLPIDVLASMADANGQISATVMERLTAAAAAEPYESVRCAFVSYGSCALDVAEGWKYRSRLWYGVGLPSKGASFGGGGSGFEVWGSAMERDSSGKWVELALVKKSITMLQALLLDDCGLGGGLGIGGGSGTGMGGMASLYQLLDSDQPFLCMLRMVLVSMREDDNGEDGIFMISTLDKEDLSQSLYRSQSGHGLASEHISRLSSRQPKSALLWSVLSPLLNMPISEARRQRVLVACCILYSEVYHAVDGDRKPLRKQYLEAILPPFVAILRRWRPLLAGIHELTSSDGVNPLIVDDRALAADALPVQASLAMISSGWAAAFASPPAAMALAMIAAGVAGTETAPPQRTVPLKRDVSLLERKTTRLHTFSSFQKPLETASKSSPAPKDRASAKAAALAAARDLERNAKIGSGRGLSAVAMATSVQRRTIGDAGRVKRWNVSDAMNSSWNECLNSSDTKAFAGKDHSVLSYKYVAILVAAFALARNLQRIENDRRVQVAITDGHRASVGSRAWRRLIHCLIETNSLFGPVGFSLTNVDQVLWRLDYMESSSRMRRCFRRNYKGSKHIGAAANYEEDLLQAGSKQTRPSSDANDSDSSISSSLPSNASILVPEVLLVEDGTVDDERDDSDDAAVRNNDSEENGLSHAQHSTSVDHHVKMPADPANAFTNGDGKPNTSGVVPGHVPNNLDERILVEFSASMVRPLIVIRGSFQITTKRINFVADKFFEGNRTHVGSNGQPGNNEAKNYSWLISSIHQVLSRRYLLRRSALELFMLDRSNFFFDFGSAEQRRNAYRAIVQARPPYLNNIYSATQRPEQLLKRTQLMERWARWEISNFEYLMELNTLAGRSYNDITQYPVFPWVLADYNSTHLDLGDPSSYRDLSKPIGALNAQRLEKFQERYASFDDPVIPKFHYGSHYSSAGTVLYYLVRVEPFTTLSIQLQGGKFDHADRMFFDIGATWKGVLEDMSDVKELVPEMFYLPEVLTNENEIDFGTTQLGGKLGSVELPPWAKTPSEFIHKHRMALESEHVSAHLHEWIDLIFGHKQRGKEAIAANNVFFYITYEGAVDIDKISDPVLRRATQDQIAYFGQTPSQLLHTPHMKKVPLAEALHLQTIFRNPTEVKPYVVPNPERCNIPAAAIQASVDSIVIVDSDAPSAHLAVHKWQPNTPDGHGMPFLFQHGKSVSGSGGGAFLRMFKGPGSEDWQFPQALAFAASGIRSTSIVAITPDNDVVTGGHADNTVKLISSDSAKTIESASGHCAPVTCLALSSDGHNLVTGSRDTTVILWRIHQRSSSQASNNLESVTSTSIPNSPSLGSLSESSKKCHIEGPIHVLRGHLSELQCCCVNSDLGVAVSCSKDPVILLHSVRRGRLLRKLDVGQVHAVALSSGGVTIAWNKSDCKLRTFTINGIVIATASLYPFSGNLSCIEVSVDGQSVLIGSSSCAADNVKQEENSSTHVGSETRESEMTPYSSEPDIEETNILKVPIPSICFLNLHTLQIFHTLELNEGQDITAMELNKDNTNLVVSTADKQLIVFTNPALSLKIVDQMLRLGWEGEGLSPLIK